MGDVISSSEMHTVDDWKWIELSSPLPVPVQGLRGATVANMFYVTGKGKEGKLRIHIIF